MIRTRQVLLLLFSLLGIILAVLTLLILVAVGRTLTLQPLAPPLELFNESNAPPPIPNSMFRKFINLFGESLKIETVSTSPGQYNQSELLRMHEFLRKGFPLVFNTSFIRVETVNQFSLLFTIKGSDPNLMPYMLCSHLDVVPVVPSLWTHDPFLGTIVPDPVTLDRVVWGRGAIDVKSGVMGIMSALEILLENKWQPDRSFYVAFGHDEEVSGGDGAAYIAKTLTQRKVKLSFILDEGLPIIKDVLTGIDVPVAIIGVTEKGRMNVRVTASGVGGHSSIPPKEQAVTKLAKGLAGLDKYPQPSMFGTGPERDMLTYLAHKASWPFKLLFSNLWLFGPIVSAAMSRERESNAILRTTTAVTLVRAGIKENVVPATAWALVNHRVHPSQTLEEVLEHDRWAVGDFANVEMVVGVQPHPVSPYGAEAPFYQLISSTINHVYPEAVAVPGLMIGNTDTFAYLHLTNAIYRMNPVLIHKSSVSSIHGKDERLPVTGFESAIQFFRALILASDSLDKIGRFAKKGRFGGEL